MRESILFASIRSLFVAFFSIVGICLGFFLIFILIALISDTATSEPEATFTPEIVANAEGQRKILSQSAPVILKINIQGVIGLDTLKMETIRKQLIESRENTLKNNRVKAILLHINSPGGTVTDSDGIYHALKAYKEQYKVPVYAYVEGLCASGGIYIAMAADKIYSNDASLIGSIGVITPSFVNFSQLMEKIGMQSLTLYAGKGKDELNPMRPWKPDEGENLQSLINYFYTQFVDIVVSNRPEVNREKLTNDYGAKLFTPIEAQEAGLITASGTNIRDVLKKLLSEISITDEFYQVVELQHKTWYSELLPTASALFRGQIVHQIQLSPDLDSRLMNQFLYLYRPERM